jgi:hypothetical protein
MIVLAGLLVACGGDDDNDEPTVEPTTDVTPTTEVQPTEESTTEVATPDASPIASPVASPVIDTIASPVASPVVGAAASPVASPVVVASPGASPVADASPVAGALPVGEGATNGEGSMEGHLLSGTVTLPGTINERYVISGDGCVGLGRYAGVEAGQQVVVKDESGTIVAVTTLAATDSQVDCSWTFEAEVPASDFYTVTLPLIAEHVFSAEDVARSNGELQLTLP